MNSLINSTEAHSHVIAIIAVARENGDGSNHSESGDGSTHSRQITTHWSFSCITMHDNIIDSLESLPIKCWLLLLDQLQKLWKNSWFYNDCLISSLRVLFKNRTSLYKKVQKTSASLNVLVYLLTTYYKIRKW